MIIRLLTSATLSILFAFSALNAQDTLKIITYNIEGMKPGTNYPERLQAIIRELKLLSPDIIGLQEVAQNASVDNMAQIIADSLSIQFGTEYNVYSQFTHTAYNSYGEGVGIISKWPVTARDFQVLPIGVFPRKALWTQIDIHGSVLHFFTTHLAYREEDNVVRVHQVNTIKAFIESKVVVAPAPVILTGDFNCTPDSEPIAQLLEYPSTWNMLNPNLSGYTYPSTAPSKKIDYIFIRGNGQLKAVSSALKFDSPYEGSNYPSDHWGIMTIIVL